MSKILDRILNAGFEQWFLLILNLTIASLASLLIYSIIADQEIRCYYTGTSQGLAQAPEKRYEIYAYINWSRDIPIFATLDKEEFELRLSQLKVCAPKNSHVSVDG